ncbi:ribonuclease H-like domain-containing protein [Tanacetum coccineum]
MQMSIMALVKMVRKSLKARLGLLIGSSQRAWFDFDENFYDLSEMVYMHQPPGFVDSRYPHHVCLLQRSLYGLKQAPRAWFQRFAGYATRAGFSPSRCDSSLFICTQGSQVAYLLIYVDDIILTASSSVILRQIIDSLHKEFDMTDLGALNYFLGISVVRHSIGLFLSQKKQLWTLGLHLYASATTSLVGYTDADWAGFTGLCLHAIPPPVIKDRASSASSIPNCQEQCIATVTQYDQCVLCFTLSNIDYANYVVEWDGCNLAIRGVALDYSLCPLCGLVPEDVAHVLFRCEVSQHILLFGCLSSLSFFWKVFFALLGGTFGSLEIALFFMSSLRDVLRFLMILLRGVSLGVVVDVIFLFLGTVG